MRSSGTVGFRVRALAAAGTVAALVLAFAPAGRAQQHQDLAFEQIVGAPRGLPHLPPQGAWGEVINVSSRWVVIQNHTGQQYPISLNELGQFLVRWPTRLEALGNHSLVEAVGLHLGNNVCQTVHVDVFEGGDQNLVSPMYNTVFPNNAMSAIIDPSLNRMYSPWHFGGDLLMRYGWAYPTGAGLTPDIATKIHVVGNPVNLEPLRLSIPGNKIATVVPPPGAGYTITQVTRGEPGAIRKGDHAFLMPRAITPRGLVLSQFVLYKSISLREFMLRH